MLAGFVRTVLGDEEPVPRADATDAHIDAPAPAAKLEPTQEAQPTVGSTEGSARRANALLLRGHEADVRSAAASSLGHNLGMLGSHSVSAPTRPRAPSSAERTACIGKSARLPAVGLWRPNNSGPAGPTAPRSPKLPFAAL